MSEKKLRLGVSTLANSINKVEDPTAAIRVVAEHHERLSKFEEEQNKETRTTDKMNDGINADWAGIVDDIKAKVEGPVPWDER